MRTTEPAIHALVPRTLRAMEADAVAEAPTVAREGPRHIATCRMFHRRKSKHTERACGKITTIANRATYGYQSGLCCSALRPAPTGERAGATLATGQQLPRPERRSVQVDSAAP